MPFDVPWPLVSTLLTSAVGVYAWVESRQRATRQDVEALRAASEVRLDALERSHSAIAERLDHLPTSTELHHLTVAVSELKGEVRGSLDVQRARVDSLQHITRRIEGFLERGGAQ